MTDEKVEKILTFIIGKDGIKYPTWKVGDKKSKIATSKKSYVSECPCGLIPSQCDYHK